LNSNRDFLTVLIKMLSIKTISASASAERLAEQVQQEHNQFFEQQEEFAIKKLREKGLYLTRGQAHGPPDQPISVETVDAQGGKLWLQMNDGDELRGASGGCIGCGLAVGSLRKAACYMGCRNAHTRLYPVEGHSVPMKALRDGGVWKLYMLPRKGICLCLVAAGSPPEKLKSPSPRVVGILKR